MNYLQIVRLVMNILFILMGLFVIHFVVFGVVGLFRSKRYPKADKQNRFGILIPARNEERVIASLIESIQKNEYPQDKLQIFVVAHNCTDGTAQIARACGATVYEYNSDTEFTKGYALKYLISAIERDFGTQNYNGFFIFDTDNILDKNYISKMNDAFEYYHGESVITSYRNSKNFGGNLIAGLYGMYFAVGCRLESRGRTVLGCSTRVTGTGYLINSAVFKNGWPYVSLTEDWEFTADQILYQQNIRYCDEAVFYDEQPTSLRIMWRQRVRWARGHLLVFYARFFELLADIFKPKTRHRFSVYDFSVNIVPVPLLLLVYQIVQFGLELLAPIVDPGISWHQLFFGSADSRFLMGGILQNWAVSSLFSLPFMMLIAIVMFIAERKRIRGVSFIKKVLIVLFFPAFIAIQTFIHLTAFFCRNLGWKPIPHKDKATFDTVNQPKKKKETVKK